MKSKYRPQRKIKGSIFSVEDSKPFKLSRSRIENFIRCPRCFYIDRKHGTEQPPMFAYSLNLAVDELLKDEHDLYRTKQKPHPYCVENGMILIPFSHINLNDWRNKSRGIRHFHKDTNLIVFGAVDDVWVNIYNELIIVDYKATSTTDDIILNDSYKRQMEIYQWLFRKNGFNVSNTAYFVYCNGDKKKGIFKNALNFNVSLLPYEGSDMWVENVLFDIKKCLASNILPDSSSGCDYCRYYEAMKSHISKY